MGNAHSIVYAPQVRSHLQHIAPQDRGSIRRAIEQQLANEPGIETRNRKPLNRPAALDVNWELRTGRNNRNRVFYRIDTEGQAVIVVAIGEKRRSRLYIAGREVEL